MDTLSTDEIYIDTPTFPIKGTKGDINTMLLLPPVQYVHVKFDNAGLLDANNAPTMPNDGNFLQNGPLEHDFIYRNNILLQLLTFTQK